MQAGPCFPSHSSPDISLSPDPNSIHAPSQRKSWHYHNYSQAQQPSSPQHKASEKAGHGEQIELNDLREHRSSATGTTNPPVAGDSGSTAARSWTSSGKRWWRIRLFRGMVNDIRRRVPYYWSDWLDAWDYRVVPATVYMYFAKYDSLFLFSHCFFSWV